MLVDWNTLELVLGSTISSGPGAMQGSICGRGGCGQWGREGRVWPRGQGTAGTQLAPIKLHLGQRSGAVAGPQQGPNHLHRLLLLQRSLPVALPLQHLCIRGAGRHVEAGQLVVEASVPPICRERLDYCVHHFQSRLPAKRGASTELR